MTGPDPNSTPELEPNPAENRHQTHVEPTNLTVTLFPKRKEKGDKTSAEKRAESPLKVGQPKNFNLFKSNR